MKVEITTLSDGRMQNCNICQKFNLSASTVANVLKDTSRFLEVGEKSSPPVSSAT
jgi:hypothetical protein